MVLLIRACLSVQGNSHSNTVSPPYTPKSPATFPHHKRHTCRMKAQHRKTYLAAMSTTTKYQVFSSILCCCSINQDVQVTTSAFLSCYTQSHIHINYIYTKAQQPKVRKTKHLQQVHNTADRPRKYIKETVN